MPDKTLNELNSSPFAPSRLRVSQRGILTRFRRTIETARSEFGRVHGDQRGSISIISVFVLMMFTMTVEMH